MSRRSETAIEDRPIAHLRAAAIQGGWVWLVFGVLTVFTYNTWVLWKPMNGRVAIFDGYLSEFSASDQPNDLFFRGGDLITAILVLIMGVAALWRWPARYPDRPRWHALGAILLGVFGLSTFFDAFFSMDCSPTLSERCRVAEAAGQLSTIHYAHDFTSVGAQIGICGSMIAICVAMFRNRLDGPLRVVMLGLTVAESLALVIMMAMLALGIPGIGYPQAVMVAVASLWFCGVGWRLSLRPERRP